MIFSFAITGVSAQKIEWKYSTPNNYWETEKNIKWSDTPENSSEIIPISENKAQYIDGLGGTFNELGWDALCTLPEEKKNEILYNLFSPKESNYTYCRMPIGASDFAMNFYSLNEEHAWKDYRNVSKNIHEITIQFHPDLLTDTFLNKNQMISIRQLFRHAERGVAFSRESIAKVRPLLKTLTCENDSFYSLIKLLIILHELSIDKGMRELSTGQFAANVMHQHSSDESLGRVMDYLSRHYSEVIRLSEVAEMVNMSESSFCRFFKQHTSKSFIDFLTDIRLGAASRALIDSSLSIAEIGYDCGFNNLSNFNRIFKKKKGVTPSEFRDNYRKNKTII